MSEHGGGFDVGDGSERAAQSGGSYASPNLLSPPSPPQRVCHIHRCAGVPERTGGDECLAGAALLLLSLVPFAPTEPQAVVLLSRAPSPFAPPCRCNLPGTAAITDNNAAWLCSASSIARHHPNKPTVRICARTKQSRRLPGCGLSSLKPRGRQRGGTRYAGIYLPQRRQGLMKKRARGSGRAMGMQMPPASSLSAGSGIPPRGARVSLALMEWSGGGGGAAATTTHSKRKHRNL
ncbi:hypothetical protein AAFF_G00206460 [Aldrovandia affinis]|uniref:Uncharacterized protein n=1 Tax=Aldrovandia affinis TaxID=143900 RepID=A0AAD7RHH5_9TELE|nr:hypothetical protein AAFF_G00206460 [Aldrovandia affinis]